MSKFSSFAEYPPRSLAGAEATLLTAWASLERFHENLVLVGGLALKYLTKPGVGLLPGPVTMDVDFGVTLAAEAGGQYGSMADDLSGQGFKLDEKGRYVRQFETMPVFIDFLTEHPTATTGTVGVDGVPAGIFPGVARALATRQKVAVEGKDLFGAPQKAAVPVSGIGPLLVLKLNAFAGRQQAKDAYDVLLAVSRFAHGPDAAIAAFLAEASAGNRGYARAVETLRSHFFETGEPRSLSAVERGHPGVVRVQRAAHRLERHGQPRRITHGGLGTVLRGPSRTGAERIEREDEPRRVSLEVMLRGTCDRTRLLDLVENFTLFSEHKAGLVKIIGQNHQFLGGNNAIASMLEARKHGHGRGGVFWQTQGSGKSFSMVFCAQKVLRKVAGNWTFVVVTDRVELDDQIAKTFKATGAVSEAEGDHCHAASGAHLRELLRGNHRYVFTLIHKFQTQEMLCDRPDVIVLTDEAHRSQ